MPSFDEDMKTYILEEGKKYRLAFEQRFTDPAKRLKNMSIVFGAAKQFLIDWSVKNDNRGSIVSNTQPFLQNFEIPEYVRVFSPDKPNYDLEDAVVSGKIMVNSFSKIIVGDLLANAINTLVKQRWQDAVLSPASLLVKERPKCLIAEEYQSIMSLGMGGSSRGDGEYLELQRGFGGVSLFVTQSIAAMKAKAAKDADFNKLLANIRTFLCAGTSEPDTIEFMQKIAGKVIKERTSATYSENANDTALDALSEKFSGKSDSLSISYTKSQQLEDRIESNDIVEAEGYTAHAVVFDGVKLEYMKVALRPTYWSDMRDSYELMNRCNFDVSKRSRFTKRILPDALKVFLDGGGKEAPQERSSKE